jgi:hypothetical protein
MAVGLVVHRARRGRRDGRSGESGDRQNEAEQGEQVSARGGHGIGSKDSRRCGRSLQYGRKSELNRLKSLSYYLTDSRKGDSCPAPKVPHSPDRLRGDGVSRVKAHAGPRDEGPPAGRRRHAGRHRGGNLSGRRDRAPSNRGSTNPRAPRW